MEMSSLSVAKVSKSFSIPTFFSTNILFSHGRWRGGQPMCPKFLHYAPNWWSTAKEDVSGEESGKRASRWPAGHPFWLADQALASTLPNFLHPPHLLHLVLKPLTKSIKSKSISPHSFPNFLLFIIFLIL
jgi:hypothetical protein